jgi:hypothetical protein
MRTVWSWSGSSRPWSRRLQRGDGVGVRGLVVDEEAVVVRVPAVIVAPGELQGHDVPGDAELALQALPGAPAATVAQAVLSASASLTS